MAAIFLLAPRLKRRAINGLFSVLILLGGFPIRAQQEPSKDIPLSVAECQVWTALGRSVLGWGTKPADDKQFVIFYRPLGDGYVEQCPWSHLGVKPPRMHKPNLDNIEFFGTPMFEDGGQIAVVDKTIRLGGSKAGPHGVFMQTDRCTLRKLNGAWVVQGCRMLAIT